MKFKINIIIFIVLILAVIIFTDNIYANEWINSDSSEEERIWVDTSHWENRRVWVQDGYYRDVQKREWIDTSHTVNRSNMMSGSSHPLEHHIQPTAG